MKKDLKKSIFSVFLLAMIIILVVLFSKNVTRIMGKSPRATRVLNRPMNVEVAAVKQKIYDEIIGASGRAYPSNKITRDKDRENLATRIKAVYVDVGDFIKRGDKLLEFDTQSLLATLESRKARVEQAATTLLEIQKNQKTRSVELRMELEAARALRRSAESRIATEEENYQRALRLRQEGLYSKLELDTARSRRDQASAELEEAETKYLKARNALDNESINNEAELRKAESEHQAAKAALSETEEDFRNAIVVSNIDGIVMERFCNPNEIINYNERLIAIGVIDPVHFVANLPQENLLDIGKGQEAEVIFDSFPNRVFTGEIVKVDPSVDASSGTFETFVEIQNRDLRLRPGLSGSARISNSRRILSIPRLGVVRKGRDAMVFVVVEDEKSQKRAEIRKIILGDTVSVHELEVLEGLDEGELVIVHGLNFIRDGDLVSVKERERGEDRIDIDMGVDIGGE